MNFFWKIIGEFYWTQEQEETQGITQKVKGDKSKTNKQHKNTKKTTQPQNKRQLTTPYTIRNTTPFPQTPT